MTATDVLDRLGSLGVRVTVAGDRLRLTPPGRVPPDLLNALKRCLGDVITILNPRNQSAESAELPRRSILPTTLGGSQNEKAVSDPGKWDWLVYMPTDRFRAGNYLVRLYSEVLGEEIALVSGHGQVARAKALGLVAYLPEEIERLAANPVDAEGLRTMHAVKKRFDGKVTGGGR